MSIDHATPADHLAETSMLPPHVASNPHGMTQVYAAGINEDVSIALGQAAGNTVTPVRVDLPVEQTDVEAALQRMGLAALPQVQQARLALEQHQPDLKGRAYVTALFHKLTGSDHATRVLSTTLLYNQQETMAFGDSAAIMKSLGTGGFGEVSLLWHFGDEKVNAGLTAAKISKLPIPAPSEKVRLEHRKAIERFRREIDLMRKLAASGVVPEIKDDGALLDQAGRQFPYYLMSYVRGWDVKEIHNAAATAGEPQAPKFVAGSLYIWARLLKELHKVGIIHRDLKPGNIRLDERGNYKLMDLGLGKDEDESVEESVTGSQEIAGTFQYSAPEQITRRMLDASKKSDVYSLGVIAYEAVTGKLPVTGNDYFEIRKKHEEDAPIDFECIPDPHLRKVIASMLLRNPDERCSLDAALDELRRSGLTEWNADELPHKPIGALRMQMPGFLKDVPADAVEPGINSVSLNQSLHQLYPTQRIELQRTATRKKTNRLFLGGVAAAALTASAIASVAYWTSNKPGQQVAVQPDTGTTPVKPPEKPVTPAVIVEQPPVETPPERLVPPPFFMQKNIPVMGPGEKTPAGYEGFFAGIPAHLSETGAVQKIPSIGKLRIFEHVILPEQNGQLRGVEFRTNPPGQHMTSSYYVDRNDLPEQLAYYGFSLKQEQLDHINDAWFGDRTTLDDPMERMSFLLKVGKDAVILLPGGRSIVVDGEGDGGVSTTAKSAPELAANPAAKKILDRALASPLRGYVAPIELPLDRVQKDVLEPSQTVLNARLEDYRQLTQQDPSE